MSQSEKKPANAVGAKTARACDSCLRRRARWYCAADDAFLCQGCDSSVHSANPLARRHERLRLKTASSSSVPKPADVDIIPSWHQGFKRKARTPRPHHHTKPTTLAKSTVARKVEPLVPDLETASLEETLEEEQLIYRVPIFDPVLAEFYTARTSSDEGGSSMEGLTSEDAKPAVQFPEYTATAITAAIGGLPGFLPSDVDFSADVESLLGCGLDEDSFCMEGLGLMESRESPETGCCMEGSGRVKEEMDNDELAAGIAVCQVDAEIELSRETLDLNFDCGTPTTGGDGEVEEEQEEKVAGAGMLVEGYGEVAVGRRRIALRLDYEAVIAAWSTQDSPWADGERPQFNPDDCWLDYMGLWGCGDHMGMVYGGIGGGEMAGIIGGGGGQVIGMGGVGGDAGGREARVSRYREKRRTRLFSKKIRYEVRKLNAEKRPRMKGRFVKRSTSSSFAAATGVAVAPHGAGSSSFTYC